MIEVIPYKEDQDILDDFGKVWRKKGVYVNYGINTETLENVCLPDEEFWNFVSRNCFKIENSYYLKGI